MSQAGDNFAQGLMAGTSYGDRILWLTDVTVPCVVTGEGHPGISLLFRRTEPHLVSTLGTTSNRAKVNLTGCHTTSSHSQRVSIVDVHILDRNVGITSAEREVVERRLHSAFDQFSDHVRNVDVSFSDINGPKGGEDIQCRIKIALALTSDLVVEGTGVSVESVAAETADRASLAVSRRLERHRDSQGPSMSGE